MMLAAIWRGWWLLGALFGVVGIVMGIHDLRHREDVWAKQRQKLPQEWQERHGSKWTVQGAWVGIGGGLVIVVVCMFQFLTD
jgi:fatty acid desaturase